MSQEVKTESVVPESSQTVQEPAPVNPVQEPGAVQSPAPIDAPVNPVAPVPAAPVESEYEKLLREEREAKQKAQLEQRQKAALTEQERRKAAAEKLELENKARLEKQEREAREAREKREAAAANFSIVFGDLDLFKRITRTQKAIVEEFTYTISETGLYSRFMDPGHVVLLETNLLSDSFRKYECTRPGKFSLRLEDFEKILARGKTEFLKLGLKGPESLNVQLIGKRTKEYDLHLIESSSAETPLPKLTYDSSFELEYRDIDELLSDIEVSSNHIAIDVTRDKVSFRGKGDTGNAKTVFDRTNGLTALNCEKESSSTYSIEYLKIFLKALKPEKLLFELSSKMPMRLTFKIPNSDSFVRFYIAPRVQE